MDYLFKMLDLDEVDRKIISLLTEDPEITHSDIAKSVKLSQPAVGARVKKMKESGILKLHYCINFQKRKINMVRIDLSSQDPNSLLEDIIEMPHVINAYRMLGKINLTLWLIGNSWVEIDDFVNQYIKNKHGTRIVMMNPILSFEKNISVSLR